MLLSVLSRLGKRHETLALFFERLLEIQGKCIHLSALIFLSFFFISDSPSALLVVAGVSTIVGLMVILLLLTLYLKRKRRNSDEENTSLAGTQNQDNRPNCASAARATSGKFEQNTELQFSPDTRNQSVSREDNNTLLPGFRSKEKQPNCACVTSGTLPENPLHQVSSMIEQKEMHEQSMFEKHQENYCPMSERKRSQSLGAFGKSNLTPVVE